MDKLNNAIKKERIKTPKDEKISYDVIVVVGTKFWAILKSDEAQLRPGNAKNAATIVIIGE